MEAIFTTDADSYTVGWEGFLPFALWNAASPLNPKLHICDRFNKISFIWVYFAYMLQLEEILFVLRWHNNISITQNVNEDWEMLLTVKLGMEQYSCLSPLLFSFYISIASLCRDL